MKSMNTVLVRFAGAGAVAFMLASPAFAAARGADNGRYDQSNDRRTQQTARGTYDNGNRNDNNYNRNDNNNYNRNDNSNNRNDNSNHNNNYNRNDNSNNNRSYRENERVNATGRVTAFSHERDGYRVQLDRGGSFWVPESRIRNHVRDLRVGISIGLGGIFRGGSINVDAVSWPGDNGGYYGNNSGYGNEGYVRGVVQGIDFRRDVMTLRDDASGRLIDVDLRGTQRTSRLDANDLRRGDYVTLSGGWLRGGIFSASRIESVRTR
jgi:hypothetical protein